jgi:DNA-binding XRE family transcriptional regulator
MTNIRTHRTVAAQALSKAKKAIRRADRKIRVDDSSESKGIEKLKAEAYKLETMIAEADTRCQLHITFCDRIRARRKSLKLTQADIADRIKITASGYSQIESGNSSPSLDTISRVAEALGCNPIDLLK